MLHIYSSLGQLVRTLIDEEKSAGARQIEWDGKNVRGHALASGVYYYRLQVGDFVNTRRMILLK